MRFGEAYSLIEILDGGKLLQLDDGSRWKVRPSDSGKTTLWIKTQLIVIDQSADHLYPYRLTNLDTLSWEEAEAAPS